MSKVRVYELANELKIDNKELVDRLKAGGMLVKNHMSTLDDSDIRRAKEIVKAGSVSEVIEEKRLQRNVIRRRKVVQVEETETIEETMKAEPFPETKPEVITPVKESPARIIKKPSAPEPVKRGKEAIGHVTQDKAAIKESEESDAMAEEVTEDKKRVKVTDKTEAEDAAVEIETTSPEIEEEAEVELDEALDIDTAEEKGHEKAPGKKPKKRLKDRPARIIRLPEPVAATPKAEISGDKAKQQVVRVSSEYKRKEILPAANIGVESFDEESDDRRPKKRKDRKKGEKPKKEVESDIRLRHKKVEVFERADLYEDRRPRLKDRKSSKKTKDVIKRLKQTEITTPKASKRRLKVPEHVTVSDLAKAMGVKGADLIKLLIKMGVMGNINMQIDFETACLAADEFGYELELDQFEMEVKLDELTDKPEDLKPRPPVVTIMGHVDHGKTSLLDYIRSSNIIAGESGGITQHIGAYYVERESGDIAFLDTPGHEAFTAMRARGAKVTDIIILVVAADDGVMPQTREAINHARAAKIPIIVAINKMDKPEANPDKVIRELAELELTPEEWGGDTIFGKISAKTGQGVDELMELILLQSEILELKANPNKPAKGTIIEAQLDKSKGSVATVLVS